MVKLFCGSQKVDNDRGGLPNRIMDLCQALGGAEAVRTTVQYQALEMLAESAWQLVVRRLI